MLRPLILALIAALALASGASAANPVAVASPVAAHQETAAAPAKPKATIIPGSPLDVLTGGTAAAKAPAAPIDNASPLGSGALGLSLTSLVGAGTEHGIETFVAAVKKSTQLTPVTDWAKTFGYLPQRRDDALAILRGLGLIVLPALAAEALARAALARPRAALTARAEARRPLAENVALLTVARRPARPGRRKSGEDEEADEDDSPAPRASRRVSLLAILRRLGRALVCLAVALLPLAAFVLVSGVLLGTQLITARPARLAVIALCNAYLAARLALAVVQFLTAPKAPQLRLVAASNARAAAIFGWCGLALFTGAAGYTVISICEILGLPRAGMMVLLRLLVLAVHLEVALMIWRSRRVVGRWIAGPPGRTTLTAETRARIGRTWQYPALFYILALWVAWAGGVHNAFGLLLRIVVVLLGTATIGRLTWSGTLWLVDHLLGENSAHASRFATFYGRARTYGPLIRIVVQVIIVLGCVLLILEGWGIRAVPWLERDRVSRGLLSAFFSILLTVAVAVTLWEAINAGINGRIERLAAANKTRRAARLRTLLPMLQAAVGVPIGLVAGLVCLSDIGVNAAPLLAGAGVLGIAVGFGSQKLVQDIITGLFLLLEDAVQVGDIVNLAGMQGTVERLSIRTIRLRGLDGSINIIPFSAVTTVTNQTRDFGLAQISVQVQYDADLTQVYKVLEDIAKEMRAEPRWGAMIRDDLKIFGLDQFGASALVITGQIRTGPGQHWAVRREFYARVKIRFEEEGIEIPFAYLPPAPPKPAPAPVVDEETPVAEQPAGGKS